MALHQWASAKYVDYAIALAGGVPATLLLRPLFLVVVEQYVIGNHAQEQ